MTRAGEQWQDQHKLLRRSLGTPRLYLQNLHPSVGKVSEDTIRDELRQKPRKR